MSLTITNGKYGFFSFSMVRELFRVLLKAGLKTICQNFSTGKC